MEALANPIGLGAFGFGACMVDVLDRQVELIGVVLGISAILSPAVGKDPGERDLLLGKEGKHAVIEYVGRCQRGLPIEEFRKRHLAVGIDEGLLIDPAHTLERSHIEGILRPTITRAFAFKLPVGFLLLFGLLQRQHLGLGQYQALLSHLGRQGLQALVHILQIVPLPHTAHPRRGDG